MFPALETIRYPGVVVSIHCRGTSLTNRSAGKDATAATSLLPTLSKLTADLRMPEVFIPCSSRNLGSIGSEFSRFAALGEWS